MECQFNTITRGAKHRIPEKEGDIQKLTVQYMKSQIHTYQPGRKIKGAKDRALNVVTIGATNLERLHTVEKWFKGRTHERSAAEEWDDEGGS
jgi:hypothetical protein